LTVIDYIGNHRIFLTKVRTLWGLGTGDHEIDRVLNLWVQGERTLPPGCEVTYELEAVGILRSLLRPKSSADAFKAYYDEFKERHGVRPTALEAYHDHYTPKSLRAQYGSWHRFVESMGDLNLEQSAALKDYGTFLDTLELTPMTKSYKMLVLLAMLNEDRFPGEMNIDKLANAFRRLARRSAILARDVGPALENDTELRRHLEQNPIAAWSGGRGTGHRAYFAYENQTFRSTFALKEEHRAACRELAREIVDWRLAEYMARVKAAESGAYGARRIECKVSHSGGNPILFLPDRKRHPGIPSSWTMIRTEDGDYEANFVHIAVNVIRKPGDGSNRLPALMRAWFGPDAGRPGTNFKVVFEQEEDCWRMNPAEEGMT
jgi:hypothetical protein